MTHLLDTDICSAHLKRPAGLAHRFIQYGGGLAIASVTLAELYAGAFKISNSTRLLAGIASLRNDVSVLDFDSVAAEQFGKVKGGLSRVGFQVATPDLMIASIALVHGLTLVTHNTADFAKIPGLRLDDWLRP
ncbi:MAG: type II toxin-antitoxin system VapC family toxin [Gemmataceae bacterium]